MWGQKFEKDAKLPSKSLLQQHVFEAGTWGFWCVWALNNMFTLRFSAGTLKQAVRAISPNPAVRIAQIPGLSPAAYRAPG